MKQSVSNIFVVSTVVLLAVGCKQRVYNAADVKDSWNAGTDNNPGFFEVYGKLEYKFDALKTKTSGSLDNQPWSDTYWPNSEGGITARWRFDDETLRYKYKSPYSPADIDKMAVEKPDQINMLSPAEKYDIVTGGYRKGWPLWAREAAMTTECPANVGIAHSVPERVLPGGAQAKDWEGKCHAWTPAALHFPEPGVADVEATTASGKKFMVHFGSSDIKALLIVAYDMFLNQYPDYARIGTRCEKDFSTLGQGSKSPCFDTNAGAFFVLATNLLQKGKLGFVIDYDPGVQVWNQPAWRYTHKIVEGTCPIAITEPASRTEKVAHVVTMLDWIGELSPTEEPHGMNNRVETVKYEYCVEIDDKTNAVIGGAWIGKSRPDFIWMTSKPNFAKVITDTRTRMQFDMKPLMAIYEKSRGAARTTR